MVMGIINSTTHLKLTNKNAWSNRSKLLESSFYKSTPNAARLVTLLFHHKAVAPLPFILILQADIPAKISAKHSDMP